MGGVFSGWGGVGARGGGGVLDEGDVRGVRRGGGLREDVGAGGQGSGEHGEGGASEQG